MIYLIEAFCSAVTAQMHNATKQEKEAAALELADHLQDHVDFLTEQGTPYSDALDSALAAMGDPKEIGRELNKSYRSGWKWLSRLSTAVLILFLVFVFLPFLTTVPGRIRTVQTNLLVNETARTCTLEGENQHPLDLTAELDPFVLRVYGIEYTLYEERAAVIVHYSAYDKLPFRDPSQTLVWTVASPFCSLRLENGTTVFSSLSQEDVFTDKNGQPLTVFSAWHTDLFLIEPEDSNVRFVYACNPNTISINIPIDWNENDLVELPA